MNRSKILMCTFSVAVGVLFCGCESKFVESSPESVKISGIPLNERILQKERIDSRIVEIQKGAAKANQLITMFGKIQSPSNKEDVYTPFDLILDLNSELESKIPENKGDKLVRYGRVEIPIQGMSEECKSIDTLLESSIVYDESQQPKQAIGDRLAYSLKTCGSQGQYIEAVVAEWVGTTLELKLINKNLDIIFSDIILAESMKSATCKIKQGSKNIIDAISCENFYVAISSSEEAFIKNMTFRNNDDIRFESLADIYENEKIKATSDIKVFSNGEVKLELKKIDQTTTVDTPQ